MTKFIKLGLFSMLGVLALVGGVVITTPSAQAACTPGTGVVCPADLQPVLDDGLASLIDTVVSFGGFILPIIIVFGVFYMLYRWFRRRIGGSRQV